ncbi:helix-turn-helix domain-containing protein [Kitasatospora sp. NPDC058397]|uniref:helix-turn-helix domain-containing protein n=1 Tax=unclassified Kitasatospora TaxID=2633591 RepID=UPI003668000D
MRIRRERLRELRARLGMTQEQVARILDCSRSAVSTWETTGRLPRPGRLRRLAELMDVPVRELLIASNSSTLRQMRTAAGLRQMDVAALLHIKSSTYCDVEKGRQKLPHRWIPVLSGAFGVSHERLTALSAGKSHPTLNEDQIP